MRPIISLGAALALCSYSGLAQAQDTADTSTQAAPPTAALPAAQAAPPAAAAAPAPAAAAFQLDGTSWTFTDTDGTKVHESIDASGNYISQNAEGKHLDHGVAVMKGDKACFTSAMTKEGEVCWTTRPLDIGQSMDTVSSKGKKLTVTRVAYVPLSMPK